MNTPTNHYVTIKDLCGKHIRGTVVHFQPNEASEQPQSAIVYVATRDWLGPYSYEAIYSTSEQSFSGHYTLRGYSDAAGHWLLMGTFDASVNSAPLS